MTALTKEAVISRAIGKEVVIVRADKEALERSCAALIAKRDAMQADLDAISKQIEQGQQDIRAAEGLIEELTIEVAAVSSRVTKEG